MQRGCGPVKTIRALTIATLISALLLCVPTFLAAQTPPAPPPTVMIHTIAEKDVTPEFQYVGRIEAKSTVAIRARVEGFLQERSFEEGRMVKKGQRLFTIEKAPYEIIVEQRKADLASAEATLANATSTFKRKEKLRPGAVVSEASLDESKANKLTAEANVLKAKAALRSAELDLSYTDITSPIEGKMSAEAYSVGSLVGPSSDPLATVTSVDPIYVTIGISEKQMINARKRGIDIENPPVAPQLRLSDESVYDQPGEFNYLSPSVNQGTDTITARAEFPNAQGVLIPGQFVTVVIRPKQKETSIVVPQIAVQRDSEGYFVLVINRDNKVEVRRIQAERQDGTDWVVSDGLVTGEKVIVDGIQKVRPQMTVKPVPAS